MIRGDDIDEQACFNDMVVVLVSSVSSCMNFSVLQGSLLTSGRQAQGKGSHRNCVSERLPRFRSLSRHSVTISMVRSVDDMICTNAMDWIQLSGKSAGVVRMIGWMYSKSLNKKNDK